MFGLRSSSVMEASENNLQLSASKCELCQKQATRRCAGCHKIYYCTKKHQKEHWRSHRSTCRCYKVGETVVATRDVGVGEVVVKEAPLIWGPSSNTLPVCLSCGKRVDGSRCCLKCGWPICSELCEKSPRHLPECRFTVQRGERVRIGDFETVQPVYKCVLILRCLYYKQFLPKIWAKLGNLQTVVPTKESLFFSDFTRRFFKLWSYSVEDILKVNTMITVHAHEVPPFVAIYGTSSFFTHSCSPNCTRTFTESGEVTISAITTISEGTTMTLSYTNPLRGTQTRRHLLHETRFFWCHCPRCEDPTEFGTYFSALKCDCGGRLLPASFTNQEVLPWSCNNCQHFMSSYSAHDILERIQYDLEELDKSSIDECRRFLESYLSYLHEDHFFFFEVKLALCELGRDNVEMLSEEELELKTRCCESVERLVRILAPGEKEVRGRVLFEKSKAVGEAKKRC